MGIHFGEEDNKLQMGVVAILVLMVVIMIWYISRAIAEKMCGGMDQGCRCNGNETMVGKPDGVPHDSDLSKILAGY